MLVRERGIKIGEGFSIFFNNAGQLIQPTETIHLLCISQRAASKDRRRAASDSS